MIINNIQPSGGMQDPDAEKVLYTEDFLKSMNKDLQKVSEYQVMTSIQKYLAPIGYLLALIAAFVFTFILPGSGLENTIVPVAGSVIGLFGLKDWRQKVTDFEAWFKSKTILGALIVLIPVLALVILSVFTIQVPAVVTTILMYLTTLGGGTTIIGIFHAFIKAN